MFGLRHMPTATRHWGATAHLSLCAKRNGFHAAEDFVLDDTGDGPICGRCITISQSEYGIFNAQEFVEGVST